MPHFNSVCTYQCNTFWIPIYWIHLIVRMMSCRIQVSLHPATLLTKKCSNSKYLPTESDRTDPGFVDGEVNTHKKQSTNPDTDLIVSSYITRFQHTCLIVGFPKIFILKKFVNLLDDLEFLSSDFSLVLSSFVRMPRQGCLQISSFDWKCNHKHS